MNGVELAAAVGLTYRRIDTWTRNGYLRPVNPDPGMGMPRCYPQSEIDVAACMKALTDAGMTPSAAHQIARGDQQAADRLIAAVLAAAAAVNDPEEDAETPEYLRGQDQGALS